MSIKLGSTTKDHGYTYLLVDGQQVSQHTDPTKAVTAAFQALIDHPGCQVETRREVITTYTVSGLDNKPADSDKPEDPNPADPEVGITARGGPDDLHPHEITVRVGDEINISNIAPTKIVRNSHPSVLQSSAYDSLVTAIAAGQGQIYTYGAQYGDPARQMNVTVLPAKGPARHYNADGSAVIGTSVSVTLGQDRYRLGAGDTGVISGTVTPADSPVDVTLSTIIDGQTQQISGPAEVSGHDWQVPIGAAARS